MCVCVGGGGGGSAGCLPEQGLSIDFTQRGKCLKTSSILIEPSFNKGEWVTHWLI